jgi:hypothetical protein
LWRDSRVWAFTGEIEQVPGLQFFFATSDEESGKGVAIAIYDTKKSADAAASTARELVAGFAEFFTQASEVAEYDVDEFWVR